MASGIAFDFNASEHSLTLLLCKSRAAKITLSNTSHAITVSFSKIITAIYTHVIQITFHVAWRDFHVTATLIVFSELLLILMLRNILSRSCYVNQRIFKIGRFYARSAKRTSRKRSVLNLVAVSLQFVSSEITDRIRLKIAPFSKNLLKWFSRRFCLH